jgi:hypothetical protein
LLADASQIDAAKDYVAAADDEIYPEEKKMLDEAKAKIARVSEAPSPAVSPVFAQPSPMPAASPR